MSDKYRTVTVEVKAIREKSIIVQCKNRTSTNVVARSLLNGFDDLELEKMRGVIPRELTFRVFAWKADELGLV